MNEANVTNVTNISNVSNVAKEGLIPWVEKYRPLHLDGVISHSHIVNVLSNLIQNQRFPHVIFYGPPGTGKTTTILACARKIYGDDVSSMVLELNGSDDRGISIVREQIKEFSSTNNLMQSSSNLKLVVLDEADSMTYDAQFALRQVIENYTQNTRFCFICNYITKIIPGILSRCVSFNFSPISDKEHKIHLQNISINETVNVTDTCLDEIIKMSEGDMRRSINVLQALHMSNNTKESSDINELYQVIGYPNPSVKTCIINIILNNNLKDAYQKILSLKCSQNLCVNDILKELVDYVIQSDIKNVTMARIITEFAKIEVYLANNVDENIQLGAILATMKLHL